MEKILGRVHVYGMPQCKTCQRALDFLRYIGVHVAEFRDVKTNKLSEAEIREAISGNLCRCTGYVKQVEAIQLAAARMRGES